MHRRPPNYGGSCRSLLRINSQHMRSVLPSATTNNILAVAGDHHCSPTSPTSPVTTTTSTDFFFKDGRKISVGDCALFKPPQNCPPFIGLICWLRFNKENNLQLGVNWLYRPAELKLCKGTLLDSAPNEIFYSFHKDETPAASLLHPCKVAFLPRVEGLPTGTSSFVCRRVYDIANKCLWWLTDQNFINERQEEVDQLLNKTRTEMRATLQPDDHSPKQVNAPTSTSQLKPASDDCQNNNTLTSQVKGKKRVRVDHGSDRVKRGVHYKIESNLKSKIARITEKGGVVDLDGVEKLVQLMERKMDLVSRSMLVGVMAATDKVDCLNHFVQLRGLPILDEWLQDIHKGKIEDRNSLKDNDKSIEEFLLVLLCALDKLPVNLHALQMCNIGRSVNHLRSHKNLEIQRKARSLVDTWKKRVEAEMTGTDAKCVPTKSTHGGIRTPAESDIAVKSSITQNFASKTTSPKSSNGENNMKSSSSPGLLKPASSPTSCKESQPRTSFDDVPLIREDRSSSSNQSRSVTASQKETSSVKISSTHKEKFPQSALSSGERVLEGGITEGSSRKLIVKIPNWVHSPAQGVGTCMSSRASSPVIADKKEHFDPTSKAKIETCCNVTVGVNLGSCQNNDSKDGVGLPAAPPVEECSLTTEDTKSSVDIPMTNQWNSGKLLASSFSSMNALLESCKYSEENPSTSLEDDIGINLLASVATGELVSPTNSTERSQFCNDTECDENKHESLELSDDKKWDPSRTSEDILGGDGYKQSDSSSSFMRSDGDAKRDGKSCEKSSSLTLLISTEEVRDCQSNEKPHQMETFSKINGDGISKCTRNGVCVTMSEKKTRSDLLSNVNNLIAEVAESFQCSKGDFQNELTEQLNVKNNSQKKSNFIVKDEVAERTNNVSVLEAYDEVKVGEPEVKNVKICVKKFDGPNSDMGDDRNAAGESHNIAVSCSTSTDVKKPHKEAKLEDKEILEHISVIVREDSTSYAAGALDLDAKVKFDLNEGYSDEDLKYGDAVNLLSSAATNAHIINNSSPFSLTSISNGHSASITVAAAAKGPFVPPEDLLLRNKGELGWKGSAVTSAFRPAESRKALETSFVSTNMSSLDASTSKKGRHPLDIDLNVPDERVLEEMASRECVNKNSSSVTVRGSAGLDFDLNRVNESNDNGHCSTSSSYKPLAGFDLNNGPGFDDTSIEQFPQMLPPQLSSSSIRMNSPELGNFSSWFLPGNTCSTVAIPSILPDRREQRYPVFPPGAPQRTFIPSGVIPFSPDIYRGSMLASSSFQFPVFSFGPISSLPSGTFPVGATSYTTDSTSGTRPFAPLVNSQLLGPVVSVASQFQRPYKFNLPDNRCNGGFENSKNWGKQGLDLNSAMDSEVKEEILPLPSSQRFVTSSQALAQEHPWMYSVSGGILKRKEPEGSWAPNESSRYKQSSRQ